MELQCAPGLILASMLSSISAGAAEGWAHACQGAQRLRPALVIWLGSSCSLRDNPPLPRGRRERRRWGCPGRDVPLKKLLGKASESHPPCLPSLPGQSVCSSPRRCQAGLPSMRSLPDKISPTPGRRHLSLPDSQPFFCMDACSPCPTGIFQPAAAVPALPTASPAWFWSPWRGHRRAARAAWPQGSPALPGSLPLLWFRLKKEQGQGPVPALVAPALCIPCSGLRPGSSPPLAAGLHQAARSHNSLILVCRLSLQLWML